MRPWTDSTTWEESVRHLEESMNEELTHVLSNVEESITDASHASPDTSHASPTHPMPSPDASHTLPDASHASNASHASGRIPCGGVRPRTHERNGTLSWINVKADDDDKLQQVVLKRGDIFRLTSETVFYLQNNADEAYGYHPQNLQIYAIFPGSEVELQNDLLVGAYTPVHDLVLGFDNRVLQSTLSVPEEVIEELRGGENQPLIVDGQFEISASKGIRALIGTNDIYNVENKKKKKKKDKMMAFNVFNEDHDVDNCFGWSVVVTSEELDVLKDTNFGVFMVNLAKGSMMAPHWTPNTVEIAIVLHGQGVIEVICPGIASETKCENSRLMVEEGDVFVVPRAHPMAQMSYNNDSFVFMGFMLKQEKESPQYLAGKLSILQRLDRKVLAKSFNVRNTTIDWILETRRV
ncbi:putative rmlC-like cupin domain superfamily, rmlC-like jelly roll protein [Helianthus anomalus]